MRNNLQANRRQFLASSLAAVIAGQTRAESSGTWSGGRVEYVMPAANHSEFQVKVVFADPQHNAALKVGDLWITGVPADTDKRAWSFHARGLKSATEYSLSLWSGKGASRLSDDWPLKTFPDPDADEEHVRLLVYTCAGGHPLMSEGENSAFLPMATRRALLNRGMSFQPNAVIAIGDQIYWDQRTVLEAGGARTARALPLYERAGLLDRTLAAAGTRNEDVLKIVAGLQITPLYGTLLRSTPTYFINDDHDYFENDEATERFVTLPPYDYQQRFTDYVRSLYQPDFLPEPGRHLPLSGDRPDGTNRSFGALRWGNLLEAAMYDCAGFLSLKGQSAGLVPGNVERWLIRRTSDETVRQFMQIPSHPMGWSAGKWREWYPDVADAGAQGEQIAQIGTEGKQFRLTTAKPKFMWQQGWWQQHQRLVQSLSAQKQRPALLMSGDLHATGHAQIVQSGDLDLSHNPVNTFITGPLGTGTYWPSRARGTMPQAAGFLELANKAEIREKNGFTIVDAYPDRVRVRLFAWRRETNSVSEIADLPPYHDVSFKRT